MEILQAKICIKFCYLYFSIVPVPATLYVWRKKCLLFSVPPVNNTPDMWTRIRIAVEREFVGRSTMQKIIRLLNHVDMNCNLFRLSKKSYSWKLAPLAKKLVRSTRL